MPQRWQHRQVCKICSRFFHEVKGLMRGNLAFSPFFRTRKLLIGNGEKKKFSLEILAVAKRRKSEEQKR